MPDEDLKARAAEAWEQVLAHPKADMRTFLQMEGLQLKGGKKPVVKECPFCGGRESAALLEKAGSFIFTCRHSSCSTGGDGLGISKYIQLSKGVDWKEAKRILHELTGVADPYAEAMAEKERKKREKNKPAAPEIQSVKPLDEGESDKEIDEPDTQPTEETNGDDDNQPEEISTEDEISEEDVIIPFSEIDPDESTERKPFIRIPEKGRTAHEAFWLAMDLSPAHREELKKKRGYTDEWITANGFKTSTRANRAKLEAIAEEFPPGELLRAGLCVRWPGNPKIEVAKMLCGVRWDEDAHKEVVEDIVVIPYINSKGRIIGLRPHKLSLSNKTFREADMSSEYTKQYHNISTVYGEHLIQDRPDAWEKTCVICEGEHKACALRLCGIPAIAFPGIQFLRQNKESRQAISLVKNILNENGIKEVIVVFDSEDKSDKPFHKRFDAEIYARYTALELEDLGFKALFGILPDSWRVNGKADWDGRLAYHAARVKDPDEAIHIAGMEFSKLLSDRKERKGHTPAVRVAPRQVDFLDAKEDVINQALHRLRYVAKIFEGGKYEVALAAEIQNFCPEPIFVELRCKGLCDALRESVGGYYMPKAPSDKMVVIVNKILLKLNQRIEELEESGGLSEDDELSLRGLRAAVTACYTILYRYPKCFTDFTIESRYKVLVKEPDGGVSHSRLVTFRDRNGIRSKPVQMSAELMRSAQEMRKFFLSAGSYHFYGGQDQCDALAIHLDVRNYQRTIEEIDTYGWNKQDKFWLLGDCAVVDSEQFIFPDESGIIWIKGTGYKNSDNMAGFTSKPPKLFPETNKPKEFYAAIDWKIEREECYKIWCDALSDYKESFGGYAGYALVAGILQYMSHPEVLREIGGKPSIAIQGEKGSGKTKSLEFGMRLFGFPRDYGYISLGGTKVGLERSLCQFSCIPFHLDEWRNINADEKTTDLIRNCYNETSSPKGTPNGNKAVRNVTPLTTPIVTGEDGFTDPALRSRFVRIFASKDVDNQSNPMDEAPIVDIHRRDNRYNRIMERSEQYHRIGRLLFTMRGEFSKRIVKNAKDFQSNPNVMAKIKDSRARQVFGVFFGALTAAEELISAKDYKEWPQAKLQDMGAAFNWFMNHGSESSEENESDVFRKRIFDECMTMIDRGNHHVSHYIRVWPGKMNSLGQVKPLKNIEDTGGRLYVFIAAKELFDEYAKDKRQKGENVPMAKSNVMGELQTQPCWVKTPKPPAAREHRCVVPNGAKGTKSWWILDYKLTDPELRRTFQHRWELELNEMELYLAADGISIQKHSHDYDDEPAPKFLESAD